MFSCVNAAIFFALFAFASATNVITSVTSNTNLTPGQPFTITWTPDSSSSVSLILRKGEASNLNTVGSIANNIPNTGSYTWYPDSALPGGTDYALEIVGSDGSPNYSHYFGINNDSVKAATTGANPSGTSASVKVTTLPENLVTDSILSDSATVTNTPVLIVSGNSTMTSIPSTASRSGSSARNQSASSTVSASVARSASQSVASATNPAASSASPRVSKAVGGVGLMTILALMLSFMVFSMM
jgi:hypothetical protein